MVCLVPSRVRKCLRGAFISCYTTQKLWGICIKPLAAPLYHSRPLLYLRRYFQLCSSPLLKCGCITERKQTTINYITPEATVVCGNTLKLHQTQYSHSISRTRVSGPTSPTTKMWNVISPVTNCVISGLFCQLITGVYLNSG